MNDQVIYFKTVSTMNAPGRIERMRDALGRGTHPLGKGEPRDDWLSIVGYGPSLRETWSAVTQPCITCSGGHDFLLERGITPTWHAESDPWPAKALFTRNAHDDVIYLIASCCDPAIWENVQGKDTRLWHCGEPETEQWIRQNDPRGIITGFGTTVGERCVELGGVLGFRKFRFFGIDCSFTDEQRAGPHQGGHHEVIEVEVPTYGSFKTSHAMLYSAQTLVNALLQGQIDCEFYGNGLARALMTRALLRRQAREAGERNLPIGNIKAAA